MSFNWRELHFLWLSLLIFLIGSLIPNEYLGLLIALSFAVYTWLYPKNAMIILLAYIPLRPILIELNPGLKLIGDAIIFVALLRVLWSTRKDWKSWFKLNVFEWAFIVYCIFGAVIGFVNNVSPVALVFQLRAFLLLFLLIYIVRRLDITKDDIRKFLWSSFAVAAIICIHGLIEKVSIRTVLLPQTWIDLPLSSTNQIRIYGLIGNPNALGLLMMFMFLITLYLKSFFEKGRTAKVLNIGLVLFFGVWILTYSRGGLIVLTVATLVYLLLSRNWRFLKKLAIIAVSAILFVVVPAELGVKIAETTDFGQKQRENQTMYDTVKGDEGIKGRFNPDNIIKFNQNVGRLEFVKKGLEIFKDHPITGTGFATFGDSATQSYLSPIYEDYDIEYVDFYSDNQYIQVIVQTGAIGVILFAIFLLGMLFDMWKRKEQGDFLKVMVGIVVASYFAGLVYNIWEEDIFTLYFFIFLGFVLNGKSKDLMLQVK
ncbi:O-antigen ligase family protein [Bacillus salitolerans]|uniref:O-antigen ligase family protein n=1 Tax=Bacillus salitolerans TaxID=1437434 RepID=A0ABW4LL29_9BACI